MNKLYIGISVIIGIVCGILAAGDYRATETLILSYDPSHANEDRLYRHVDKTAMVLFVDKGNHARDLAKYSASELGLSDHDFSRLRAALSARLDSIPMLKSTVSVYFSRAFESRSVCVVIKDADFKHISGDVVWESVYHHEMEHCHALATKIDLPGMIGFVKSDFDTISKRHGFSEGAEIEMLQARYFEHIGEVYADAVTYSYFQSVRAEVAAFTRHQRTSSFGLRGEVIHYSVPFLNLIDSNPLKSIDIQSHRNHVADLAKGRGQAVFDPELFIIRAKALKQPWAISSGD